MPTTVRSFGQHKGQTVHLFSLSNSHGMTLEISNYRGIITKLILPDRNRQTTDITLGYDRLEQYLNDHKTFFGAIVGRYANRIANASFDIHHQHYPLDKNTGKHCLHSGSRDINDAIWSASRAETPSQQLLILKYCSSNGVQGFPGTLMITVTYALSKNHNQFTIHYHATTDQTTPVNFTNHAYFNLSGAGNGDILDHQLSINANYYTPTTDEQIPTGEYASVLATPFDFRDSKRIGNPIANKHPQLIVGKGFDHNFVLDKPINRLGHAATVYSAVTGIGMEVSTTQPGLQFYSGNYLPTHLVAKGDRIYQHRGGLCLETQHFPDSVHHPDFPTTLLSPGQTYDHQSCYTFTAQ